MQTKLPSKSECLFTFAAFATFCSVLVPLELKIANAGFVEMDSRRQGKNSDLRNFG